MQSEFQTLVAETHPLSIVTNADAKAPSKGNFMRSALVGGRVKWRFQSNAAYQRFLRENGFAG